LDPGDLKVEKLILEEWKARPGGGRDLPAINRIVHTGGYNKGHKELNFRASFYYK
jgi:hypothetical protein